MKALTKVASEASNLLKNEKHFSKGVAKISLFVLALTVFAVSAYYIVPALAAHTASVSLDKQFVGGGSTDTYTFTVTNQAGSDAITAIYVDVPTDFSSVSSVSCPLNWWGGLSGSQVQCVWSPGKTKLLAGQTGIVSFSATSPTPNPLADTPYTWTVTTWDLTDSSQQVTVQTTVDVTAPTTTATPSGTAGLNDWYTSDVTVTLSPSDASGSTIITKYSIDGGAEQTYLPFTISTEGTHTITYYSTDRVGNVESSKTLNIKIDKTKPTTSDRADALWHKADVTVTLTGTDAISNVAHTYYTTDDTTPTTSSSEYTAPFTLSTNGQHKLKYFSIDNAGNQENIKTGGIVNIDKTAPSTSEITAPLTDTNQKGTISIAANAVDALSGVQKVEFYNGANLLGTDNDATGGWIYDWATTTSDDGSHSLTAKVYDMAGNSLTSPPVSITIDNTAPSFSSITASPTPAKAGDVTITFTASETLSAGLIVNINENPATYSSKNGNVYTYTYTVTPTDAQGPATISITGLDITGNSGTSTSTSALTIDTIAPTASITLSPASPVSTGTVAVTLTTSESIPSAPTLSYTPNGKSPIIVSLTGSGTAWTGTMTITELTGDGNAAFSYSGTDAAGNTGAQITSGSTFVIDTVPPVVNTISSPATSSSQSFDITYTASDSNEVNSAKLWYKLNDGDWTAYGDYQSNTGTIRFTAPQVGRYMFYVQAKDNAGKESSSPTSGTTTTAITEARPTAVYVYTSGSGTHVLNWDAYNTIQNGIDAVDVGGTVNVAAGTYTETGQIVINKDLSIIGTDKTTTIIKPAQDTQNIYLGDGTSTHQDANGWILINSDVTFNLKGVTLDGAGKLISRGIFSHGHGTIEDNIFKNIRYAKYAGMAIELYGSDMTIKNNNFNNIERIGVFTGFGSVVATITGNTYVGKGDGDFLDYAFEVGRNGHATISNNIISDNRGVASDSSTSAGILVTSYYNPSTPSSATITGNKISASTDGIAVGYDATDGSTVVAHENDLSGNIVTGIVSTYPTVDAIDNWWGSKQKSTIESYVSGNVNYAPWYLDSNKITLSSTDTTGPTVVLSDNIDTRTVVKDSDTVIITATFSDENGLDSGVTPTITISNGDVTGAAMTSTTDSNVWTYSWNVPAGSDGSVTVSVSAQDAVGNVNSPATGKASYTIDNTLPVITVNSVTTPTNVATQTITGTYTEVNLDKIFVNGIQANINGNAYSAIIPLTEGTNTITVVVTDLAGNSVDNSKSIVLDTNLPSIENVAQTPEYVRLNTPVTVSATVKDNVGGVGLKTGGVVLHYMVNGIVQTPIIMGASGDVYSAIIPTTTDFVDGIPVAYYITAEDKAGNTQTSVSNVFVIDGLAPSLTSYSPSTGAVGVDTATTINLAFSEDMDNTTFSGVTLKDTNNNPVTINLQSYNSATHTAIFNYSGTLGSNKGYTVTLTGLKDLAGNALPDKSWSFTTATSFSISLSKKGINGWNLISLPVIPTNTSIENVLSNVKNDVLTVWKYDSTTGNWSMYKPNDASSDLKDMTAGFGYWINYNKDTSNTIDGSGSLFLEGNSVPPSRPLKEGWNLIGYYQKGDTNEIQSKCALSTLTSNINDWIAASWQIPVTGYDNNGKTFTEVNYNGLMTPGQGYWIFMKSAHMYAPGMGAKNATTTDCV